MKVKRLIPAVAMLLISAMLLGTSTFAWFSMNTQVTATNLQITAKSNSTYLLISGTADNASDKSDSSESEAAKFVSGGTNAETSVGAGDENTDKIVYPAYYATATGTMPGTAASGTLSVTAGHWYKANSTDVDNATVNTTNFTEIASANLVNHVVTYTSWLTLTEDSEDYDGVIKITPTITDASSSTALLVTVNDGTNSETIKVTSGVQATTTNSYHIASDASVEVTYQVYIDGTATNVNSTYFLTNGITGAISVVFDID